MTKSLSVLLVDDNYADNYYHRFILEKIDTVETVHSFEIPDEALSFLQQADREQVDLIFMDLNMPGMDGFELLEELEQIHQTFETHPRIVVLSNSPNPSDMVKVMQHPWVIHFMNKPLTKDVIRTLENQFE